MKFQCSQCSTRYAVPDEKIPANAAVRFTCKTCGNVIRLNRAEANDAAPAVSQSATAPVGVSTRVTSMAEVAARSSSAPSPSSLSSSPSTSSSPPPPSPGSANAASSAAPGADAGSDRANYLAAPPGEATQVFMATAGLFKRRRNHRVAAVLGITGSLALAAVIGADIAGIWQIPGMGIVYDVTGVADPNVDRAIERTESKLSRSDLSAEQKQALRDKLMGLQQQHDQEETTQDEGISASKRTRGRRDGGSAGAGTASGQNPGGVAGLQGVRDALSKIEDGTGDAQDIYSDTRKTAAVPTLPAVTEVQTPALPEGITQEAIYKVISDNNTSMSLCMGESMRKGEQLKGRMELELTIAPTGLVTEADVITPAFRSSVFGACTVRRVRTWHFPAFTGEPVTVVFPYVLSTAL